MPSTIELLKRRIRVARGEEPGDLVLAGGQVVNVFTCEVQPANVVLADGWIAGVGPLEWEARERIDVAGQFILPGLIDAHMHLESTLLSPAELARVVVPHGTATIVADPHEVGNVLGVRGIEMLLAASAGLPLDIFFMAPSCVPCTSWEHAGGDAQRRGDRAVAGARARAGPGRSDGLSRTAVRLVQRAGQDRRDALARRTHRRPCTGHDRPRPDRLRRRRHRIGPRIDHRRGSPGQSGAGHAGPGARRLQRPQSRYAPAAAGGGPPGRLVPVHGRYPSRRS